MKNSKEGAPFLVKLQARGDRIYVPIYASPLALRVKERLTQCNKTCGLTILGQDFPKSVSYHSICLKIRNSYLHKAPFNGSFCFIFFFTGVWKTYWEIWSVDDSIIIWLRGDIHIHIATQNIILTFLVDRWILRKLWCFAVAKYQNVIESYLCPNHISHPPKIN